MADQLYDEDILVWAEQQADLLRRLARGEPVNDVDREHVVEEIEDVGRAELHSAESFLSLMLVHLLKVRGWPDQAAGQHWPGEIVAFQQNLNRRFSPSMRQRIDLGKLYASTLEQLDGETYDEVPPRPLPTVCPFTLDQLLTEKRPALEQRLSEAGDG